MFTNSSSIIASPSSVSILEYKLETSNVARRLFPATLPKFFSRMMKSVVSLMWEGGACAKGLRNSSIYADSFSVWLLTEEITGRPGLLGFWILGSM